MQKCLYHITLTLWIHSPGFVQGIPLGIRNDILSAVIPHATLFDWKMTNGTHVVIMAIHITVPIMDRITSTTKKHKVTNKCSP